MPLPAQSLSTRVLIRLISAEAQESDPWLRDDLKIARLTVAYVANGEAVWCSPCVLASYMVLGLHPDKVWPAIQARRKALGPLCEVSDAPDVLKKPPKKPAQSVKLWTENTNGARAVNSRAAMQNGSPRTISVPMSAAPIAALYRNSDAPSSAKKRPYSLKEIETIVAHSGAPPTVVAVTLAALSARGAWPNEDGPATTILCVSLLGVMYDSTPSCCRRTAQRRIKRALNDNYWRTARSAHSWTDCPKCGKQRDTGKCGSCAYQGRSKDANGNWTGEFMRVPTYEFDIEKFRSAPRCKELRHFEARTYAEHKETVKRGDPPNVTEMPARKSPQPDPAPSAVPAASAEPTKQDHSEHHSEYHSEHRGTGRPLATQATNRLTTAAKRVMELCGLPNIGSAAPYVEAAILAESKFRGAEIEEAAKYLSDCVLRDQRAGITVGRFYFRDAKWRNGNGGGQQTAAAGRAERSQQSLTSAWHKFKDAESERTGAGQADSLDPDQLKE